MNLKLLMGNEAIAYGAVGAGVQVATGYPGTPSSEVLSTLARLALERVFTWNGQSTKKLPSK